MASSAAFRESARVVISRPGNSPWFQWGSKSWHPLGVVVDWLVKPTRSTTPDEAREWAQRLTRESQGHLLFVWVSAPAGTSQVLLIAALRSEQDRFPQGDPVPYWAWHVQPARTRWERLREEEDLSFEDPSV